MIIHDYSLLFMIIHDYSWLFDANLCPATWDFEWFWMILSRACRTIGILQWILMRPLGMAFWERGAPTNGTLTNPLLRLWCDGNHHFKWVNLNYKRAIFNSCVKSPEAKPYSASLRIWPRYFVSIFQALSHGFPSSGNFPTPPTGAFCRFRFRQGSLFF